MNSTRDANADGPISREVRLRERPKGLPGPEHFEVVSKPVPALLADEMLVRNRFFRVSASVRMMTAEGAESVEGVPFPALQPGDTLGGEAIGEVVTAPKGAPFAPGDLVVHHAGFRELAVVAASACAPLPDSLPDPALHLGHGWTAYAALTRAARVKKGDTVFVSSAAGAIGSMAAVIARRLGAARVVGSTSRRAKAEALRTELGYDAAIVREDGPLLPQLRRAAPQGIDVALDNVGGEDLRAAVLGARKGARIVVLGALSGQLAPQGTGRAAPVELDSFPILLQRISILGYSADDDPEARGEYDAMLREALARGPIRFPHVRLRGIDQAPAAIGDVARGRYVGVVLVEL